MSFEIAETFTKKNSPPEATISYMPNFQKSKPGKVPKDRKPQLRITIPTTLCGVSKSKVWYLLLGTGVDCGKIRVAGDISKPFGNVKPADVPPGFEATELAHAFKFTFGFVPKLGDEHFDGERRPVKKITDEIYEIDVPVSWFQK